MGGSGRSAFATLEDKIVQRSVVEVLSVVYEEDFCGFSYGFRPGRSPHDALDALSVGIERKKVNWVLDDPVRWTVGGAEQVVDAMDARDQLGLPSALVVAAPVPEAEQMDPAQNTTG